MSKNLLQEEKNHHDTAYNEAYARLNDAQKEAVDTIEGPVMVVAGPGTGKTQVLTLRVATILKNTDTSPESILALTFTESGVRAMRDRLRSYLGSRAYQVGIYTFHAFAQQVINDFADEFPRIAGGRLITELEQVELLESLLATESYRAIRPTGTPLYYLPHIKKQISALKREYISPSKLLKIIEKEEQNLEQSEKVHEKGAHKGKVKSEYLDREKKLNRNKELYDIYNKYSALLTDKRLFDFDDMISEVATALENNETLLRTLQETYHYILADEHQDVNGSQNKILELLASYHERPNIFVVGDEKQAIYRFQGASLENFLYFQQRFADTKTISLTINYRSTQEILDLSHQLVEVPDGPLHQLRVPLTAHNKTDGQINYQSFSHQSFEDSWLVDEIKKTIEKGTLQNEIAVLVRTNADVELLTALLRKEAITVHPSADTDILVHPLVTTMLALLRVVVSPSDEEALSQVLHGPYWGMPIIDVARIYEAGRKKKIFECVFDDSLRGQLDLANPEALERLVHVFTKAREKMGNKEVLDIVAGVISDSGLRDMVMKQPSLDESRIVRRFYDEIESLVRAQPDLTIDRVVAQFKKLKEHSIALESDYIPSGQLAVQVMTVHKSKGLEFDRVFVPHLTDKSWGKKTRAPLFYTPVASYDTEEYHMENDDEIRLLYVAFTRARTHLYLLHSTHQNDGREAVPSRLLETLDKDLLPLEVNEEYQKSYNPAQTVIPVVIDEAIRDWLVADLKERGFSATSFNNYVSSPWNYIYRNVLRIPEPKNLSMLYGTAMHAVLDRVTKEQSVNGEWPEFEKIPYYLKQSLQKLPLSPEAFAQLHEKGLDALTAYLPHLESAIGERTKTEQGFQADLPISNSVLSDIPLVGNFDRVDLTDEGDLLQVVDYKTGKPKSRNAIEGITKNSDGNYKRQLVFYALLLSLQEDVKYHCRRGVLSFIEPTTKGVIKEEVFDITNEEIAELRGEIEKAAEAITSGSILSEECDPAQSEYCDLAAMLFRDQR